MVLKVERQVAVPEGEHFGKIAACRETTKIFDRAIGPEPVVEFLIAPEYRDPKYPEAPATALNFVTSAVLNGLSALSQILERLGKMPNEGQTFNPSSLVGMRVRFVAEADGNFVRVKKESLEPAPQ